MKLVGSFRDAVLSTIQLFLAALVGYLVWFAMNAYPPQQSIVISVALVAVFMGAVVALQATRLKESAETIKNALGRPAEFFPKELRVDDGHYFREITRQITQTQRDDTIWIMTCHAIRPTPKRTKALSVARKKYHAALEDRASHDVQVRRILCFDANLQPENLQGEYFSRHTTDHCNRLLKIGKAKPSNVSIHASRFHMGIDFLVIPGRIAAVTADAFDPDGRLKHVLCWLFYDPPNGAVINTLTEWCKGIENGAAPVEKLPDGVEEEVLDDEEETT